MSHHSIQMICNLNINSEVNVVMELNWIYLDFFSIEAALVEFFVFIIFISFEFSSLFPLALIIVFYFVFSDPITIYFSLCYNATNKHTSWKGDFNKLPTKFLLISRTPTSGPINKGLTSTIILFV